MNQLCETFCTTPRLCSFFLPFPDFGDIFWLFPDLGGHFDHFMTVCSDSRDSIIWSTIGVLPIVDCLIGDDWTVGSSPTFRVLLLVFLGDDGIVRSYPIMWSTKILPLDCGEIVRVFRWMFLAYWNFRIGNMRFELFRMLVRCCLERRVLRFTCKCTLT